MGLAVGAVVFDLGGGEANDCPEAGRLGPELGQTQETTEERRNFWRSIYG